MSFFKSEKSESELHYHILLLEVDTQLFLAENILGYCASCILRSTLASDFSGLNFGGGRWLGGLVVTGRKMA